MGVASTKGARLWHGKWFDGEHGTGVGSMTGSRGERRLCRGMEDGLSHNRAGVRGVAHEPGLAFPRRRSWAGEGWIQGLTSKRDMPES